MFLLKVEFIEWNETSKRVFTNLVKYFNEDNSGEYDLQKGILLAGPNGTGKTTFLKTFSKYSIAAACKQFEVFNTQDVVDSVLAQGDMSAILGHYQNVEYRSKGYDEIGSEQDLKIWGNDVYPIRQILSQRSNQRKMTHGTTNLDKQDLLEKYGDRVSSRIEQDFNFIELIGKDYRRK